MSEKERKDVDVSEAKWFIEYIQKIANKIRDNTDSINRIYGKLDKIDSRLEIIEKGLPASDFKSNFLFLFDNQIKKVIPDENIEDVKKLCESIIDNLDRGSKNYLKPEKNE